MNKFFYSLFLIVFFVSCTQNLDTNTQSQSLTKQQKQKLFSIAQSKIGQAYNHDTAYFIYECLIETVGKSKSVLFKEEVSTINMYLKTASYETTYLDVYHDIGDVFFDDIDYLGKTVSFIGILESYTDNVISYIHIDKGIVTKTDKLVINPENIDIRYLLVTK